MKQLRLEYTRDLTTIASSDRIRDLIQRRREPNGTAGAGQRTVKVEPGKYTDEIQSIHLT